MLHMYITYIIYIYIYIYIYICNIQELLVLNIYKNCIKHIYKKDLHIMVEHYFMLINIYIYIRELYI